ncbi:hypothetical protein AAC387_Pa09g1737 [Persea americana]
MAEKRLSLKLLVDKSSHKILFAEAGKDFVDLLFSFLALPLGSVIRLLITSKSRIDVSISKLYDSVDNLSETYIRSGLDKISLLDLVTPSLSSISSQMPPPLLLQSDSSDAKAAATSKHYYTCSCGSSHKTYGGPTFSFGPPSTSSDSMSFNGRRQCVSDVMGTACRRCGKAMSTEVDYVAPPSAGGKGVRGFEEGGFVRGVVTYMVMDDLEVMPMSTISSITLITKFKVRDAGTLEEKVVEVGVEEVLSLLKASLESKTALTDVVLK